jgi:hypothetical protein
MALINLSGVSLDLVQGKFGLENGVLLLGRWMVQEVRVKYVN